MKIANCEPKIPLVAVLTAAWSKLANTPLRLALIFHVLRLATGDRTIANPDEVDAASMYDALALTRWFKNEARQTYNVLAETETDRDQRHLVEWIGRKGQRVTAWEVHQGCRWLRASGAAERALQSLVDAGAGTWLPSPQGQPGKPTRRFQLSAVYGIPVSPESDGVP